MSPAARWLLVPLFALSVWYASLALGIAAVSLLDAWCPPEQLVSDLCTASWHAPAVEAVITVMAGVAAFGIVVATALVAPRAGFAVGLTFFAGGAGFAAWVVRDGGPLGALAAAALGGAAGLALIRARLGRHSSPAPEASITAG